MHAKAGDFRRSGSFEITNSPAVLIETLRQLCWDFGRFNVRTVLDSLDLPPESPPEDTPPDRAARRGKVGAGKSPTRVAGGRKGWGTRKAVAAYLKQHPNVTEDQAKAAVRRMQERRGARPMSPGRPRKSGKHRIWSEQVRRYQAEQREKGTTLSYGEAQRILSEQAKAERERAEQETSQAQAA